MRRRARYAIEALLMPLGIEPVFEADGIATAPGLWYGPPQEAPTDWVRIEPGWLAGRDALDPDGPDPVAMAFAWLSGDGERGGARDRFGRIEYASSAHARLGLGLRAPVDEARDRLAARLREGGIAVRPRRWAGRSWVLCPTHDVDYVRKVRPGILWRETAEYLVLGRRRETPGRRVSRFGRFLRMAFPGGDPFRRALDRIPAETAARGGTGTWFVKGGAHGPHDVGYGLATIRGVLSRLVAQGHEVGLHPSFHAYAHPDRLSEESARVASASGVRPTALRTHYLRWHEPGTPRAAASAGFAVDSTLGFSETAGFRRGTCLPFRLWDATREEPLPVWEMPLGVMESALFNRRGLDAHEALAETARLAQTCKRHGGALVALWHNTLWDEDDYPGWGLHFTGTLDLAQQEGAQIASLASALASWRADP